MYNFVNNKLVMRITANCPSTDGYEIENLISTNYSEKIKGFLAYTAIKPPINVDLEFICPINIYYIIISTSVQCQKTNGLEIFTKSPKTEFVTLNKIHNCESDGIVIFNRRYQQVFKKKKNISKDLDEHFGRNSNFMACVEKVKIRIFRTKSSVPCIGKLEIWGVPANICSEITKRTIAYLCDTNSKSSTSGESNLREINSASSCEVGESSEPILNIPEEFIDPISCEVMCLPMTLPCGKTIDQTTLEKYQESAAKWGRQPSDPFTGQLFTPERKPVFNTALKRRIDDFLLTNADKKETFNIQRTLGRRNPVQQNTFTNNANILLLNNTPQSLEKNDLNEKQETNSENNLDNIINQTIKEYKIIRFSTNDEENINSNETIQNCCGSCESNNNLYNILKCNHLICRQCLLKIKKDSHCAVCNILFCKSDVKKHHV